MPIVVTCTGCEGKLRAPDSSAGKSLRCPRCKAVMPVPAASPPAFEVVNESSAAGFEVVGAKRAVYPDVADDPPPVAKPKRRRRREEETRNGLVAFFTNPAMLRFMAFTAVGLIVCVLIGLKIRSLIVIPAPPEIPMSEWRPVEVADRYRVLMPGNAKSESRGDGEKRMVMSTLEPDDRTVYVVAYSEGEIHPDRARLSHETLLNDACATMAAYINGSVRSKKSIQMGTYSGKEVVIAKKGYKITTRVYMTPRRIYCVMCGGLGMDEDHANVERFLKSFEIIEGTTPARAIPSPKSVSLAPVRGPCRRSSLPCTC